jgi:hypothetical protein
MNIYVWNKSESSVLFHLGDENDILLGPAERISVNCLDQEVLSLHVKHTIESKDCEPIFRYWFEKFAHKLTLKQQRNYHMAINSVYMFSYLRDMDEIIITQKTYTYEENAFYHCILANSNKGLPTLMTHEVSNDDYIKRTYLKRRRNMALWLFLLGFYFDAALCSLGFWIIVGVINVIDNPSELPFVLVFVGIFFLLALIPSTVELVNTYRKDKFISNMKSQSISNFILGDNLPVMQ